MTSCGILFNCCGKYLICHSTNCGFVWGIPKGKREEGETDKEAAIRESYEECGIKVEEEDLIPFLEYKTKKKNIVVYKVNLSSIPDTTCNSFYNKKNNVYPEIDAYKWLSPEEALFYVKNHMSVIFNKLIEEGN